MTKTPILAINEVAENQNDKYITINDAFAALEGATNDRYTNLTASAAAVALTETQATRYVLYIMEAKTGDFDLVFPSTINGENAKRLFLVFNDTSHVCTVKASTGAGVTIALPAGAKAFIYQDHEDMTRYSSSSETAPYDIGFYYLGTPPDGVIVMKHVAARAYSLATNFAGSLGHVRVPPATDAVFDVRKNGSSVGTITVSSTGAFTFASSGAVAMVAGDRLEVVAPGPVPANIGDISVSFAGTRVV